MENLKTIIVHAQAGDLEAYSAIVRRFQDMAVGYAYAILGDFHLAEDAAQEAFVEAYLKLSGLREPAAFSSWFRKIIFKRCDRLTRGKRVPTVPLEGAMVSELPEPDEIAETQEMKDRVRRAIQDLPAHERTVTTLFYIDGFSQNEIGAFLDVPARTVRSRLYTARNRLRERMTDMVKEHLHEQRPSRDETFASKVNQLSEEYLSAKNALREKLQHTPFSRFSPNEITDVIFGLARVARGEGILEMNKLGKVTDEEVLRLGLRLAADSEKPERLREILSMRSDALLRHHEVKCRMIIEGIMSILSETPPHVIEQKLRTFHTSASWEVDTPAQASIEDVKDKLQKASGTPLSLEGLTDVITDMALIARAEGVVKLAEIADLIDEKLLQQGLKLALDYVDTKSILTILQARMRGLLHQLDTRYKMITVGILSIQAAEHPRDIAQKTRYFYEA